MTVPRNPDPAFWAGKNVLLTGQTGFKGAWLAIWLHRLGARITGVALPPTTDPDLFTLAGVTGLCDSRLQDIREAEALARLVRDAEPEIVFHLAAQPLVRASYREPLATFATNIQGTVNLLDALRPLDSVRTVIAITTDKVYRPHDPAFPHRETDPLGGHDPYSASKAAAEIVIASYRDAYFAERGVGVASARAGNVIGGGDWAEDRIIPDAVRAWTAGEPLAVRRPQAIRPWQHVLEPLAAYLLLAEGLWADPCLAGAYNFGPQPHQAAPVREVVEQARAAFGSGDVIWGDGTDGPHETGWLALETFKARVALGIVPRWPLDEAIRRTMRWYRQHDEGADMGTTCAADITAFEAAGRCRG